MMKPENKFRKWFEKEFQLYMGLQYPTACVRIQKHADYATGGIADLDISINGMTLWVEVKLLTSCHAERKLNVTPLQRNFLEQCAKVGVPSGVLVGLAFGPRRGYDVALFIPPISEVVHRDMFRSSAVAIERLYAMAAKASADAHRSFQTGGPLGHNDFSSLDCVVDDGVGPSEDGG